jgi:hypothetical protein
MLYYLVQAKPIEELLPELRERLDSGEIHVMHPFGPALHYGLEHARLQENGIVIWEEEDYCWPPLVQERAAVLNTYFREFNVERVDRTEGWKRIESIPMLWQR